MAAFSSSIPEIRWSLVPLETPRIVRHCPRCRADRRFVSSDRFRVNAHQRKLDVWLIYRCEACESTFNLTVHTRVSPASLGADLERFHQNDVETAWDVAFDARRLRGLRVEPVGFRVDRPDAMPPYVAVVGFERWFEVRLDRVLVVALGVPRSRLDKALRRTVTEGMRVYVAQGARSVVPPPLPM